MRLYLILIFFFVSSAPAQNKQCNKFKNGVFYIPFDDRVNKSYYIYRNGYNQVEVDNEKNETYLSIVWNSDCSYTAYLKPESINEKKEEVSNFVLDSTIVNLIKFKGDTLFYRATSFFGEKELEHLGKMIRVGEVPRRE